MGLFVLPSYQTFLYFLWRVQLFVWICFRNEGHRRRGWVCDGGSLCTSIMLQATNTKGCTIIAIEVNNRSEWHNQKRYVGAIFVVCLKLPPIRILELMGRHETWKSRIFLLFCFSFYRGGGGCFVALIFLCSVDFTKSTVDFTKATLESIQLLFESLALQENDTSLTCRKPISEIWSRSGCDPRGVYFNMVISSSIVCSKVVVIILA